jgi:hypothetical protein
MVAGGGRASGTSLKEAGEGTATRTKLLAGLVVRDHEHSTVTDGEHSDQRGLDTPRHLHEMGFSEKVRFFSDFSAPIPTSTVIRHKSTRPTFNELYKK